MKKLLALLVVFGCFLLVGCKQVDEIKEKIDDVTGKKVVLTCSLNTASTVNFVTEMSYYFEKDKLVDLGVKYIYDLSAYTQTQREAFASASMCQTESVQTKLGMRDCKEELQGANYVVEGYADKLRDQSTGTADTLEAEYTKQGWACTKK